MRRPAPWWFALVVGCGDEAMPLAELAPLCGAPAPVQLLALRDDEIVLDAAVAHGDRLLLGVRRFEVPILDIQLATVRPPTRAFAQIDARIESVDGCGNDRQVIAAGYDRLLPPREATGPWLALRYDDWALAWIDPDGAWPARPLPTPSLETVPRVRGDAVVLEHTREVGHVELWRATLGPGSDEPETVRIAGDLAWTGMPVIGNTADDVLALRSDGVLLAVPLDPGAEPVAVLGAVATAQTDASQRYVVWQSGRPPATTVPEQGWLFDRETGGSLPLDTGDGATLSPVLRGALVVVTHEGASITPWTEVIAMPGGQRLALPEVGVDGDGRVIEGRFALRVGIDLQVFQIIEDAIVPLALPPGGSWSYSDGELFRFDDGPTSGIGLYGTGRPFDLIVAPLDSLDATTVLADAWSTVVLPHERYLGPAKPHEMIGPLVVIDGGWQTLVDRDVHVVSLRLAPDATDDLTPWHTDDVMYEVRVRPSPRNGVWRARFE